MLFSYEGLNGHGVVAFISAKILALLRLSVNSFSVTVNKKVKK